MARKYTIAFVVFFTAFVALFSTLQANKVKDIVFIGVFTQQEINKFNTDLKKNEPTKTLFEQGGNVEIEKKYDEECNNRINCEYYNVKYYTNTFGDYIPATISENGEDEFYVMLLL